MKILRSSEAARGRFRGCAVAIGNCDGVHLAHRTLLDRTREIARRIRGPALLYTFWPHPAKVLAPHLAPPLILTSGQKLEVLRSTRLDAVIVERFDRRFSQMSPEAFFAKVILKRLAARALVVGYDFTFGAGRTGNAQLLADLARTHDIAVEIIQPVLHKGMIVSSSQIRRAVGSGDVAVAARLLGRPFQLSGRVVRGTGTGTRMGIQTANLKTENELIPARGVYATGVTIGAGHRAAVTNIGVRPTFGGTALSIETHIPGWRRSLLGRTLTIDFIARLRDEKKFQTVVALKKQIARDISKARRLRSCR